MTKDEYLSLLIVICVVIMHSLDFLTEMCFDLLSVLCITVMYGAMRTFFLGTFEMDKSAIAQGPGKGRHPHLCRYRGNLATRQGRVRPFM